jgi:hypothetical protein
MRIKVNIKNFLERIYDVPKNYEISLSHCFVMDEDEGLVGIMDAPIIGIAIDDENKELHFVLKEDSKKALDYLHLPFESLE